MSLDPRVRSLLDMLNRVEAPQLHDQPVEFARHNFHKLLFAYREVAPEGAEVSVISIPRREVEGGPLVARLYKPAGGSGHLPAFLWLHGGGWVLGDLPGYDVLCRQISLEAQCAVLALDYRLAPENTFPAAVDDVWHVVRWLRREALALGIDPEAISIGGDSAGGNLAAVVCLMLRNFGQSFLRRQVLVYPSTDQSSTRDSHARYGEGYFLDTASIRWFQRNYLPSESDRQDWRASPLLAQSLAGVPPALVITAECDPLTDDARAYADRMKAEGVETQYVEFEGMIHGFLTMDKILADAKRARQMIVEALRER